ncbi:MAG TPA: hypothetical protein DCF62_00840 [Porticoccaceae bacterium]|nr:hypothetical protein [Porticoccaceae bacterium]HCO59472.1 hypothetical protein [Porticoccaceae bacterium]
MSEYPEKTCEIDRLVRQPKLVDAVLEGKKSQQRRDGVYGYPGETFELEGVEFRISALFRQRLGDMSEQDAQAEGFPNLEVYQGLIARMHPGMSWDRERLVWVHQIKRVLGANNERG